MKIAVNGGHTPSSPGAGMYLNEVTCDRAVKNALIAELKARGHSVTDCTADDWMVYPQELNTQVNRANNSGADLGISIHFNAGGGTGVEVLYHPASAGGDGERYAAKISSALAKRLGIPNRGAKQRSDLWWLNGTNMTAVLVEACFVDHRNDEAAYNRVGPAAIAYTIADAVVGSSGGSESAPTPKPEPVEPPENVDAHHIWLQAKNAVGYVLDSVKDNSDDAGDGTPISYLSAWTTPGTLDVQACTAKQGWLGKLNNPKNIRDTENGSVGDGSKITKLRMYYWSPKGNMAVYYRVMVKGVWLPWMKDHTDLGGSSDDFAGNGVDPIQRVEAYIGFA